MQKTRDQQADPRWKAAYRADRPVVEGKIAQFTRRLWGGRKARTRWLAHIPQTSTPEPEPPTVHDSRSSVCTAGTTAGRSLESAGKPPYQRVTRPKITDLWPFFRPR